MSQVGLARAGSTIVRGVIWISCHCLPSGLAVPVGILRRGTLLQLPEGEAGASHRQSWLGLWLPRPCVSIVSTSKQSTARGTEAQLDGHRLVTKWCMSGLGLRWPRSDIDVVSPSGRNAAREGRRWLGSAGEVTKRSWRWSGRRRCAAPSGGLVGCREGSSGRGGHVATEAGSGCAGGGPVDPAVPSGRAAACRPGSSCDRALWSNTSDRLACGREADRTVSLQGQPSLLPHRGVAIAGARGRAREGHWVEVRAVGKELPDHGQCCCIECHAGQVLQSSSIDSHGSDGCEGNLVRRQAPFLLA